MSDPYRDASTQSRECPMCGEHTIRVAYVVDGDSCATCGYVATSENERLKRERDDARREQVFLQQRWIVFTTKGLITGFELAKQRWGSEVAEELFPGDHSPPELPQCPVCEGRGDHCANCRGYGVMYDWKDGAPACAAGSERARSGDE